MSKDHDFQLLDTATRPNVWSDHLHGSVNGCAAAGPSMTMMTPAISKRLQQCRMADLASRRIPFSFAVAMALLYFPAARVRMAAINCEVV